MKKTNFSEKTVGELKNLVQETRKSLVNLNVEKEQRKLKDSHAINKKKKDLARILTVLREKEISK